MTQEGGAKYSQTQNKTFLGNRNVTFKLGKGPNSKTIAKRIYKPIMAQQSQGTCPKAYPFLLLGPFSFIEEKLKNSE